MKTFNQASAIHQLVAQQHLQQARSAQGFAGELQISLYAPTAADPTGMHAPTPHAVSAVDPPRGVRVFEMS